MAARESTKFVRRDASRAQRRGTRYRPGAGAASGKFPRRETLSDVAFLGLGVMGYPMAGHLVARGGHRAVVFNRTAAKAEAWVAEHGGASAPTPREAAAGREFRVRLRRQRRRPALGGPRARRRLRRHEARRDLRRPHDRLRRRRARIARRGGEARARLHRRAGLRRSGRRAEWRAHGHVRRRRGGLCPGRAGHRRLTPNPAA